MPNVFWPHVRKAVQSLSPRIKSGSRCFTNRFLAHPRSFAGAGISPESEAAKR